MRVKEQKRNRETETGGNKVNYIAEDNIDIEINRNSKKNNVNVHK